MFQDQVAIITGASSGIGQALARELAARGAKVGLLARREPELAALTAELAAKGTKAAYAVADVTDRPAVLAGVAKLSAELGPVDLLIANAGVALPMRSVLPDTAEVESVLKVNLFGVIYAFEAVLPQMLQRGMGQLAAVSSLASYKGLPNQPAYSASKAAVNAYCEGLRIRLRPHGIFVTTICPGFIRTAMTAEFQHPMPFLMNADAAARRMVRALARRAKVYNFPLGTTLLVKVARWLPDRWIARAAARSAARRG